MSNYKVHIPDCIVRNEDGININSKEFLLYYYLKILHDKQKATKVQLNHNKFMGKFGIKANSTFKNMINKLYVSGLIINEVNELPRHNVIEVELNKEYIKLEPFTRLSVNLYYLIDQISHEGLRLMYYYESRINRNKDNHQFCFAGIRTIAKETKINKNKVKTFNDLLKKMKLLKIESHELKKDGTYDEFNQEITTRYNNHYQPRLEQINNYKFKSD